MLVRTRYAAYAIGEVDYVVETTEPGSPAWGSDERRWRAEIEEFSEGVRFTGVEILAHHEEVDAARVTFHAGLQRARGRRRVDASFVEESEFVRRDGRWLYSRGDVRRPDAGDPDAGDE
jgi:SEC-C motif-containing protein